MTFNTLNEWLAWLENQHPADIELGLERISPLAKKLGLKNFTCPVVTIAGTNGKGSCLALLESISLAQGYQVATYSSPHLVCFNERIRFNGHPVDDESLIEAFELIENARDGVPLTYFEFSTLAALCLFKQVDRENKLDILLLEIGLGGRLDAVNIVDNDLAIITSIDYDHMDWLGESREEIGLEKAGIFRKDGIAILGERNIPQSVIQKAESDNVQMICIGQHFSINFLPGEPRENIELQNVDSNRHFSGKLNWQGLEALTDSRHFELEFDIPDNSLLALKCRSLALDNIATSLQAIQQLPLEFSYHNILSGIEKVNLPGRFEVIGGEVTTILDVAHNPAAASLCAEKYTDQLDCPGRLLVVVGILGDKDISGLISPFVNLADTWYPCTLASNRTANASVLYDFLDNAGCRVCGQFPGVEEAFNQAKADSQPGDCILVYGSFYTVAAIKSVLYP